MVVEVITTITSSDYKIRSILLYVEFYLLFLCLVMNFSKAHRRECVWERACAQGTFCIIPVIGSEGRKTKTGWIRFWWQSWDNSRASAYLKHCAPWSQDCRFQTSLKCELWMFKQSPVCTQQILDCRMLITVLTSWHQAPIKLQKGFSLLQGPTHRDIDSLTPVSRYALSRDCMIDKHQVFLPTSVQQHLTTVSLPWEPSNTEHNTNIVFIIIISDYHSASVWVVPGYI